MPPRHKPGRRQRPGEHPRPGEIYIEFKQVGNAIKATAVDAATGTEVTVMGPLSATQTDLERIAVRKLKMQLDKAADQDP